MSLRGDKPIFYYYYFFITVNCGLVKTRTTDSMKTVYHLKSLINQATVRVLQCVSVFYYQYNNCSHGNDND